MQLEWAKHVPGRVLIVAPLAVSQQTIREGTKFGVDVTYSRDGELSDGVTITNYEMIDRFDPGDLTGIVLDESSILKSYTGKIRNQIISDFGCVQFRLACTATPAPNDHMELGNHAEFIGAMSRTEMLSMFFVHDGSETQKWRLKGHADSEFWRWLCTWAVMIRKPSDLGYCDGNFTLPPLEVSQRSVGGPASSGMLFHKQAMSLLERRQARKASLDARVAETAELVNAIEGPWLVWCDLNAESAALTKAIAGAVEVKGSDTREHKTDSMLGFSDGKIRVLVTKPSIAGFGMNWQHCANVAFVGLSDSYEQYYQAVRRCWRFGQESAVHVYVVTSDAEGAVVSNIQRKEKDAELMAEKMVEHMHGYNEENIKDGRRVRERAESDRAAGPGWELILGDCVDHLASVDSDSIHYSVFSPPFSSLYVYSDLTEDMGNCTGDADFIQHFGYAVKELYRVLKPGRLLSFHCMNLPTSKARDGVIGIRDFRGELIRLFCSEGFIYHSEVCIWKNPVVAMQRTKALGLLHKQIVKDSCMSRQGIADYLVTMRKPGDNPEPVEGELDEYVGEPGSFVQSGKLSIDIWQRYASPVWMDIDATRTLQAAAGRDNRDERHICPLQLDVIERAMQLWTNEGDLVLSPFAGIGSEGYVAIQTGRQFVGIELKRSYWTAAIENMKAAEASAKQGRLI
ncbi:MAG: helicase [bacterium]|nr:helicase [bacterium]